MELYIPPRSTVRIGATNYSRYSGESIFARICNISIYGRARDANHK